MKCLGLFLSSLLSLTAIGPKALAASGDVAWITQGNLVKDKYDRLFHPPAFPKAGLTRVNKSDGTALWTKNFSSSAYLDTTCADIDRIFILVDKTLFAINPDNGATIWTYEREGEGYTSLSCIARSNEVFLTIGDGSTTIRAIQKYSGQKTWDYTASSPAYIFNADWENYYIHQWSNEGNTLVALNQWNGQLRWTRPLATGMYASADPQGRVYMPIDSTIVRVNPWNGGNRWSIPTKSEYAYLEFNDRGQVYAHEPDSISRLDADTGQVMWSRALDNSSTVYTQTFLLKTGDLLLRTSDTIANTSHTTYINTDTGAMRWEQSSITSQGYLTEDEDQNIYFIENTRLIAVAREDGHILWTFELKSDPGHTLFQLVGKEDSLYLTYGYPGRYPPMGLIRLNATDGLPYWQNFLGTPFGIVDSDNERVYIASYLTGRSQAFLR